MLLLRLDGLFLLRFADRTFWALLLKLPPRMTRFEPVLSFNPLQAVSERNFGADDMYLRVGGGPEGFGRIE